jgi:HK97 family phage major capsid protein
MLMVSEAISSQVIDLARNRAVIFRAGASTVPMPTADFGMARVASDPTAAWVPENQAGTEASTGFELVMLRSRKIMVLSRVSLELVQDAPNAPQVIENSMASALALELDRAALRGVTPAPTGIRNTLGVQTITGVGFIALDDFADAAGAIIAANGPDSGLTAIMSPREWTTIDKLKSGDGMPLRGPASWESMQKLQTNQIPTNLGVGTNESEAYVGAFGDLIVGVRLAMELDISREASDVFGKYQLLIRAVMRGDVMLARERNFVVLTGITPSA